LLHFGQLRIHRVIIDEALDLARLKISAELLAKGRQLIRRLTGSGAREDQRGRRFVVNRQLAFGRLFGAQSARRRQPVHAQFAGVGFIAHRAFGVWIVRRGGKQALLV
jgi:hypothetical protein